MADVGVQPIAIESAPVAEVTSDGLAALKALILRVRSERAELSREIPRAQDHLARAERRLRNAQNWFLGLFLKKKIPERRAAVEAKAAELSALQERLEGSFVDAEFALDDEARASFAKLAEAFVSVSGCACIWDITSASANDRHRTRSAADTAVDRRPVRFAITDEDDVLQTTSKSLRLENANGADLVIFPAFLLMRSRTDLALVDLREVQVEYSLSQFVEHESVPSDAAVVGHTWAKCNKDGSPDRRFRDNYQIPLAQYGRVRLTSPSGLNEQYMFSNAEKVELFARALAEYQTALRRLGERSPTDSTTRALGPPVEVPASNTRRGSLPPPPSWKSLDLIRGASATAVDDAVQTMMRFAELLQRDLQQFNGQARNVEAWSRFVAECRTVAPEVSEYFARSPGATAVEAVAVREVNKLLRSVLGQIQSGLEASTTSDSQTQALLAVVRETHAAIRE
ncbi:hypothetical protein [Anaeromyxobacter oryzae]|nr:hypothetical protein [Anaeromyxobacter oryzae]